MDFTEPDNWAQIRREAEEFVAAYITRDVIENERIGKLTHKPVGIRTTDLGLLLSPACGSNLASWPQLYP